MRKLGEQWIEEIDGIRHMVKVVKGECERCCVSHLCNLSADCPMIMGFIGKDLGLVNELGCLPNPWNDKKYPTIYSIGDGVNFEIEWFVESDNGTTHAKAYGKTRQEAIDAWNQRGEVV